jgi:hypothetical protein
MPDQIENKTGAQDVFEPNLKKLMNKISVTLQLIQQKPGIDRNYHDRQR